jgi:hypothetical protein
MGINILHNVLFQMCGFLIMITITRKNNEKRETEDGMNKKMQVFK